VDRDALGYVAYFAELLDEWSPEADANETMFRLGSSMVEAIAEGVPIEPLARYFVVLAAAAAGCVRTGSAILGRGADVSAGGAGDQPARVA
jgi:recombinational DNA repair protein (RecF pathway)